MSILRGLATAFVVLCGIVDLRGQGGPPMITDDPGTPGNGKWEINLATAFAHQPEQTSWDVLAIDLNYGVGERIQLTLQTAPVILKQRGHGALGGLGGTEAALKWRFLDQESDGVSVSTFPRVIFNISQSSVRRGLADDGTRFQIPVQVAKKFGIVDLDFEFGPLVSTVGRSEWLYGIVGGVDITKTTELMAEFHGTSRMNFDRDVLAVNFGIRQVLSERCIFIGSLGHEVRAPDGDPLAFIGYIGVQLLY
ncbi:MAG: hypothetical protein QOI04_276 [Verrucomicrobiota bacterium]|jgi:hypothetical protein